MNRYLLDILFGLSILILVVIVIFTLFTYVEKENSNINESHNEIVQINLLDRIITNDNEYEILYEFKYDNGLSIQIWKQVDYNNYITLWEENRYDEGAFIN